MNPSFHLTVSIGLWVVLAWPVATPAASEPSPTPSPTPTPHPRSLADFARTTTLARSPETSGGDIVITGDNLDELGRDAVLSVAGSPLDEPWQPDPTSQVDPKVRRRWRSKVLAQSARIATLEARRADVEAEIDRLERGRLDTRTIDRIERAEAKLARVEADIRREKAELSRMVREARKQGAQPGWFR